MINKTIANCFCLIYNRTLVIDFNNFKGLIIIENSIKLTEISMIITMILERKQDIQAIQKLLDQFPVVGILGARQCSKTTLDGHSYYGLNNYPIHIPSQEILKPRKELLDWHGQKIFKG
jgi:predicted AAA+ superfamily ATPase